MMSKSETVRRAPASERTRVGAVMLSELLALRIRVRSLFQIQRHFKIKRASSRERFYVERIHM
jgi:hypothetical protein